MKEPENGVRTDTAHREWDQRWRTEAGRRDWLTPEEAVSAMVPQLHRRGARRVLDLGCGVGRHALLFAGEGFQVDALDGSESGLAYCRQEAAKRGLAATLHLGGMSKLPFADNSFDYVLSWNVIYHGDGDVVGATFDEIRRVLRPCGLFQGTMLSKRNHLYGRGSEVARNTFVLEGEEEKDHPHYYCDARELTTLLGPLELLGLQDREQRHPGHWHWEFVCELRSRQRDGVTDE